MCLYVLSPQRESPVYKETYISVQVRDVFRTHQTSKERYIRHITYISLHTTCNKKIQK